MADDVPLVMLSPDGEPSILNYNVPEPTAYEGRNLIELVQPAATFKDLPGQRVEIDLLEIDVDSIIDLLDFPRVPVVAGGAARKPRSRHPRARMSDEDGPVAFPDVDPPSTNGSSGGGSAGTQVPPATSATPTFTMSEVTANLAAGYFPVLVTTQSGHQFVDYAPTPDKPVPGLYLVETVRLSNFLGDYGAGRTIKTFSLLPGEKTTISLTTYKNSSETASAASSIFDSYTEDTADSFESAIQSENSATDSQEKTKAWNVEASASGSWGVASVEASAGASGSSNSAREEFAKNVSSATEKHAATASAQRDVDINTSTEQTAETGEQTAIERTIENINLSRTLNFVFRQMNQQHHSILHLVDVRVGFFNGFPDQTMVVPLYELDALLDYCLADPDDASRIREDILYAVGQIRDWRGEVREDFVVEREYRERDGSSSTAWAINRDLTTEVEGFAVSGVVLSASSNVLRTDGVIVESLLGQATSLDAFALRLQDEKVAERVANNDLLRLEANKARLALEIVSSGDSARARIFRSLYVAPQAEGTGAIEPTTPD
jgi:hypothetical protein